jgi:hypothetical protein
MPFFNESTWSLDELDEKLNHSKFSKSWNFERKGYKAKDSFFKLFDKNICSMGSKCLALDVSHMWRKKTCQKTCLVVHWNSFWDFLGFFYIFGIKLKYSYTIMYDCEKSSLTHELSYIGLFNFSHLNLFHINVICKK